VHVDSVVCRGPVVEKAEGGEAHTTADSSLALSLRIAVGTVKFHYLFLAPLVLFSTPPQGLLGLNILVLILVTVSGMAGNLLARKQLSTLASIALLCLLVWGRVADDLFSFKPPDTAIFLVEFGMVLFLMEANLVLLTFETAHRAHRGRSDELSNALEARLWIWLRNQFSRQGKIALGSLGISLALLPLAGFTSISSEQLPLTGALLLIAVIALLFLVTYRREPERRSRSR
jgi:hypothetical protein